MNMETPGPTPYDSYEQRTESAALRIAAIKGEHRRVTTQLRALEQQLNSEQEAKQQSLHDLMNDIADSNDIYRAVFEIECQGISQQSPDTRRFKAADHIAKQLLTIDEVLENADADTYILSVKKRTVHIATNTTSASYPQESDIRRSVVRGLSAQLLQAPAGSRLTPEYKSSYVFGQGKIAVANDIVVPVSSKTEVETRSSGFDHDVWIEEPRVLSKAHPDEPFLHSVRQLMNKDFTIYPYGRLSFGDENDYDGLFVSQAQINEAFTAISDHKLESMTVRALGKVLHEHNLITPESA